MEGARRLQYYEQMWSDVARRVVAGLAARGVHRDAAEEAVQEAATSLWRTQPDITSVDALARWTFVVALNVLRDEGRRRGPDVTSLDDESSSAAADIAAPCSVEETVMARLELVRVARALDVIRESDRALVVNAAVAAVTRAAVKPAVAAISVPSEGDHRRHVREAVRLHRARTRFIEALGRFGGAVTAPWSRRFRKLVDAAAPVAPGAAAALVVAACVGGFLAPRDTDPAQVIEPGSRITTTAAPAIRPVAVESASRQAGTSTSGRQTIAPAAIAPIDASGDGSARRTNPRRIVVDPPAPLPGTGGNVAHAGVDVRLSKELPAPTTGQDTVDGCVSGTRVGSSTVMCAAFDHRPL